MKRRLAQLAALAAAVTAAHLLLTGAALEHLRSLSAGHPEPPRMQAEYVAEVRLSKPRPAPPAPPPPAAVPAAAKPKPAPVPPAASEPQEPAAAASEPEPPASDAAAAASEAAMPASAAASAAVAVAAAASAPQPAASQPEPAASATLQAASSAPPAQEAAAGDGGDRPFGIDWPQATRISYKLRGNYRGELHGTAQVEWVRQGLHYQVHVDLEVGLVLRRRISSDGQITAAGLAPRLFLEEQKVLFASVNRRRIEFNADEVVLANGDRVPAQPGLQDEASQFVQLTYEFVRHPERLQAGQVITLPLVRVRSRKLEPFLYDVMPSEEIQTPLGPVQAFRLTPRPDPARAKNTEWILEMWFAPDLEYLPVRLRITNADPAKNIYADLVIDRAPQRAKAAAGAGSAASMPR